MKKNNQKGFTLVELIIVIAILGILAALAIPSFSGFTDSARKAKDEDFADTVATSALLVYVDNGSVATGNPLTVADYADYIDQGFTLEYYTSVAVTTTAPGTCDVGSFDQLAVTLTLGSDTYSVCK